MAKEIDKLRLEIEELRKEYELLTGNPAKLIDVKNIKQAYKEIEILTSQIFKLEGGFNGLQKLIKEINSEFGKSTDEIKKTQKSYKQLEDIAFQLRNDAQNINKLNEKDLESLIKKINKEKQLVELSADALIAAGDTSEYYKKNEEEIKAIIAARKNENEEITSLLTQTQKRLSEEKELAKTIGLTGTIVKGISKIPILGDIPGLNEALGTTEAKVRQLYDDSVGLDGVTKTMPSKMQAFGIAVKEVGKTIKEKLNDPLVYIGGAIAGFSLLVKIFKEADIEIGKLAKSFNVSYNEAVHIRHEFSDIATTSGDTLLTAQGLEESLISINNTLGSNAQINKEDLKTFTDIRQAAGLTNEELADLTKQSLAFGGSLKGNINKIGDQIKSTSKLNNVILNEKDILKDISKTSSTIQLSLKGNPEALAKAVTQAKALGLTLEQVDKTADSLLNFESSISSEIEAELLTGRQLNLEQARYYALTNNIEGLTKEIAKNVGTAAQFGDMNRLQQEAIAKSVGMSREELANSLLTQEALVNLSGEDKKHKEELLQKRIQEVGLEQAQRELKDQGNKKFFDQLVAQQDIQDKFNNLIMQLKEELVKIVQGPMGDMMNFMVGLLKHTNYIKGAFISIAALLAGKIAYGLTKSTIELAKQIPLLWGAAAATETRAAGEIVAAEAATVGLATPTIIAGIAAATAAALTAYSMFSSINDGIITPDKGLVVSGPKGSIQLDKKDSIIAGTNLIDNNNKINPSVNNQQTVVNNTKTIDSTTISNNSEKHMMKTNQLLEQLLQKDVNIYNDYVKINTANTINSYKSV